VLYFRQFVDEEVRGRAIAHTDDLVVDDVLDRLVGDCLLGSSWVTAQFSWMYGRIVTESLREIHLAEADGATDTGVPQSRQRWLCGRKESVPVAASHVNGIPS
jgi:hypothetical protein